MKHYAVRVKATKELLSDDHGLPYLYTRGEAIKKAGMFQGKIELEPLSEVINPVSMVQIPENALLHEVVKLMEDRELLATQNGSEKIYIGKIFGDVLVECLQGNKYGFWKTADKVINQLNVLDRICSGYEYIHIINK